MRLTLAEGEQAILAERPAAHSLVWPLIRVFLAALVLGVLLAQVRGFIEGLGASHGASLVWAVQGALFAVCLWLLFGVGLRRVVRWFSTWYVLTTERLILRRGLTGRSEDSVPLPAVYRVDIRQSWPQRLASTGTLVFTVAQGSQFALRDVPRAAVFRAEIVDAVSKAQQRHWHRPLAPDTAFPSAPSPFTAADPSLTAARGGHR